LRLVEIQTVHAQEDDAAFQGYQSEDKWGETRARTRSNSMRNQECGEDEEGFA
jgi:hypothetical protein